MRQTELCTIALAFLCAFQTAPAQAQSRVFVAAFGLDSNPCTFAQPCRTFQHAHDVVVANGEIDVLDPAGYGAVNITKAISIQGHGFAGLAVSSGNGITISASAGDKINLSGLLLDGIGTGSNGVVFNAGASLNIQGCLIRNFGTHGIAFAPGTSSNLTVYDTVTSDNLSDGIHVAPSGAGVVTAVVERAVMDNNGSFGLSADGNASTGSINVTVSDSAATHNLSNGIVAISGVTPTVVMVRNSTVANNLFIGVNTQQPAAIIRVTHSTITGNGTGIATVSSGQVVSFGDNSLAGNTIDGASTSTMPLK